MPFWQGEASPTSRMGFVLVLLIVLVIEGIGRTRRSMSMRTILAYPPGADQSAPAALNPDPPFRAVLITALVPVPVMAPVLVVAMKPDPAIMPYPMASYPERVRAGRRRNFFGIWLGRPVLYDHLRWRWRRRWRCITLVRMTILPTAFDPYVTFIAAIPVARHPDCLGSRPAIPMASDPHPTVSVP